MSSFFLVVDKDNNANYFKDIFTGSGVVMKWYALVVSPSKEKDKKLCCLSLLSVFAHCPPSPSFSK